MPKPGFATEKWRKRASQSRNINRRLWFDPESGYEYEPCNEAGKRLKGYWHEIDARNETYRNIDPETGQPIAGEDGEWKRLK